MNNILIIMPAYNEEKNIASVIEAINSLDVPYDVLVINDGSDDRTACIAQEKGARVISLPFNLGYGVACQTGFKYAVENNYAYVLQMDSDGQHRPTDIPIIMSSLLGNEFDIVIGSRFLAESGYKVGTLKRLAIRLFCGLIWLFTHVKLTDPSSGFQGMNREAFTFYSKMENYPEDFPDADVLVRMLLENFKIKEVPTVFLPRRFGKSMHSGIKPVVYMAKVTMSMLLIVIRSKLRKGERR